MSDTPAMSRPLGGSDDVERRLRTAARPPAADADPLAELARLIGQDDPFKGVFAKSKADAGARPVEPVFAADPRQDHPAPSAHDPEPHARAGIDDGFATFAQEFGVGFDPSDDQGAPAETAVANGYDPRRHLSRSDRREATVDQSPDAWAQGADVAVDDRDVRPTATATAPAASTGRTLIVLAAVVALTGGGLAASFLARPSGSVASASGAPPTILALAGPSKVQPPASPTGDDGQSEPSTLLDKNKNDGTATAKVVNTVEQPLDLSQAVKPAPGSPDASSPFPEPHKVKTLVVRPDGSIIANGPDGSAPVPHAVDVTDANLAFDSRTAIPMPDRGAPPATATPDEAAAPPAPSPVAPAPSGTPAASTKVPLRASALPRTPPPETAAADAGSETPTASVKQTATSIHTRPKSKPIEEASLTTEPDSGSAAAGGGFAVQLGAPPSAQEAHDVSLRLQKKFAEQLGSNRPSIHEGKSGDKSVFRIRVGNLSQDQAKALCGKLQSSGGACFVVRN